MAQDDDSLYLMSPLETATCILLGHTGSLPPSASGIRDPRRALEHVVRDALLRPPCGVAFSGGRDSSAVLAVATHVARRDGLPPPIPITKVFPLVPSAEEGSWQETVVRHLGLDDWQRVVIHDELDLVGPLATANLIAHGVVWPPMIHGDVPVVELVRGGSVIDGEGGDEVLGVGVHRIAPVTHLLRHPRPLRRSRLRPRGRGRVACRLARPSRACGVDWRTRCRGCGRAPRSSSRPQWLMPNGGAALVREECAARPATTQPGARRPQPPVLRPRR